MILGVYWQPCPLAALSKSCPLERGKVRGGTRVEIKWLIPIVLIALQKNAKTPLVPWLQPIAKFHIIPSGGGMIKYAGKMCLQINIKYSHKPTIEMHSFKFVVMFINYLTAEQRRKGQW